MKKLLTILFLLPFAVQAQVDTIAGAKKHRGYYDFIDSVLLRKAKFQTVYNSSPILKQFLIDTSTGQIWNGDVALVTGNFIVNQFASGENKSFWISNNARIDGEIRINTNDLGTYGFQMDQRNAIIYGAQSDNTGASLELNAANGGQRFKFWNGGSLAIGNYTLPTTVSGVNLFVDNRVFIGDNNSGGLWVSQYGPALKYGQLGARESKTTAGTAGWDFVVSQADVDRIGIRIEGSDVTTKFFSHILPQVDAGADIGSGSLKWGSLFLKNAGVINFNNGNATITHSAGLLTSNVDVVVPDEAYGVGWDGSFEVPTKNALYDKIETIVGGSGITTLNTLTATTQTFATGTTGTDFNISSATSTHTFNLPSASATNRGALTSSDWSLFNGKENALTFNTGLSRSVNTVIWEPNTYVNNVSLWDASQTTRTLTANLSGANDPSFNFGELYITANTGRFGVGSGASPPNSSSALHVYTADSKDVGYFQNQSDNYATVTIHNNGTAGQGWAARFKFTNATGDEAVMAFNDVGAGTSAASMARGMVISTPASSAFKINTNNTDNNGLHINLSGETLFGAATDNGDYRVQVNGGLRVDATGKAVTLVGISTDNTAASLYGVDGSGNVVLRTVASLGGGGFTTEDAQDAVGAMIDGSLIYVDATPLLSRAALTGDVTAAQGSNATTIANNAVTFAKFVQGAANTVVTNPTASTADFTTTALSASNLLGRGSTGNIAAITVGGILSFSGTVLSATEVDGSTTNELQTIDNTSDATSHTITLSNSGGTIQFIEGSGVTFTTGGTGLNGTLTINSSGGGSGHTIRNEGTDLTARTGLNFIGSAVDVVDDAPGNESEVTFDAEVNGIANLATNGFTVRTGSGTFVGRTITGTANQITITDGDGVAGNPVINVGSDIAQIDLANVYTAGNKQSFDANATNADIRLIGHTADPSSLSAGDMWYESTANVFKGRFNTTTRQFATLDGTETFTNKTLTSSTNVIGGVTMTLGSDANWDLYTRNASGILERIGNGTTGQFLGANTGAKATWQTPAGGGSGLTFQQVFGVTQMKL
jgi:hypothetical protein